MKPENLILLAIVAVGAWYMFREVEKAKAVEVVALPPPPREVM